MADLNVITEIENYKQNLGLGFRKNYFLIIVRFPNANPQSQITLQNLVTRNQVGADNASAISDAIGSPAVFGSRAHVPFLEDNEWFGLAKGFQIPGYTLEIGPEIMKWRNYPKNATKGVMTIDYYNDKNDYNYQFWRNYVREICDGRTLKYPDDYVCDVELQIFNPDMDILKKYIFERCWPTAIEDTDFSYESKDIMTFKMTLNWEDFYVEAGSKHNEATTALLKTVARSLAT